jgi:uncharacterized repeat protein (TIGR01451 family)
MKLLRWVIFSNFLIVLSYCSSVFAYGNAINTWNNTETPTRESFVAMGGLDPGLGGKAGMTVTAWVRWLGNQSAADDWANIISNNAHNASDSGQFWLQHDSANARFEFAVRGGGRSHVYSTTQPQIGVWYHVAGVYDSTLSGNTLETQRVKIYVNGILEASNNNVSGLITAWANNYFLNIGRWAFTSERRFEGDIDEVSLWNRVLSDTEIRSRMTKKIIPADETGLVGYWNLDEVSGGLANDLSTANLDGNVYGETGTATSGAATTLTDTSKNWTLNQWAGHKVFILNNTGVGQLGDIVSNTATTLTVSLNWITNPALNSRYAISAFDRWVCSDAPVGDESIYDYTIASGDTVSFSFPNDETPIFSAQNITGTVLPQAVHIYRVDQPPNFTTSTSPGILNFDVSPYYWGVHVVGGTDPDYTVQCTYDGHPQVTGSNESGLILANRSANCTTPWTDLTATLNTGADTLSQTGQNGGEYILGVPMGSATDFIVYKTVTDENGGNPETGDILLYTIVIQKPNAASLANAVFTDTTPAGTSYVTGSASAPSSSTIVTEDPLSISGINVPDHGQVTITFRVEITGGSGTTISNQGDLYYDSNADGTNDAHQLSNAAAVTVAAPSTPNFDQTTKSVEMKIDVNENGAINPGDTLRYTINIRNTGDADATNVAFTDEIPAGTTYTDIISSAAATSGAISYDSVDHQIEWNDDGDDVPAGYLLGVTITFDVTVDSVPPVPDGTVISNQGTVAYNSGADTMLTDGDTFLPGRQSTDVTVGAMPRGVALKRVLDENGGNVEIDDILFYVIKFDNLSTYEVNGLVLTDAIPNNTTYVPDSVTAPAGCVIESETPTMIISNIDMPGYSQKIVTFRVQVNALPDGVNQIFNQGTVFYDSDDDGTNDATQLTDGDTSQPGNQPTIIAVHDGPNFDQTTKSVALVDDVDGNGVATSGDTLRYNIKISNTGDNASGVVLHDPIPDYTSFSSIVSGGATFNDPPENRIEWTGAALSGSLTIIEFDVTIDSAPGPVDLPLGTIVSNQGIVTYNSGADTMLTDGNPIDPGRQTTDITLGGTAHALATKIVTHVNGDPYTPPDPVEPGDIVDYTITVVNNSGYDGENVEIWDPIPNNTEYVDNSATYILTNGIDTYSGSVPYNTVANQLEWTGDIDNGFTLTITFEVELDNPMAAGVSQIRNQATGFYDSNSDGDNDTYQGTDGDLTQPGIQPTVLTLSMGTISGTVFDDVASGNPGIPGVPVDLYLHDILNGLYTLLYGTTTDIDGYYEFTGLPSGDYTVRETNLPYYVSTPLTPEPSSVDVHLTSGGTVDDVNFADHPNGYADLSITKTCETLVANGTDQLAYTITVTNNGPDTADVTLTDDFTALIAAGLSNIQYSEDGGALTPWPGTNTLTWAGPDEMEQDESHEVRIYAAVAPAFIPDENIAMVASDIFDPAVGDNAAICVTQVCPEVRTAVKFENPACTACSATCTPGDFYVSIPDDTTGNTLDLTTSGTIEAWIQATSCTASDADAGIVMKGTSLGLANACYGFGLAGGTVFDNSPLDGTPQNIGFRVGGTVLVADGYTLTPGKWYHIACTWDSTDGMRIYINGILETPLSGPIAASPTNNEDIILGQQTIVYTATHGQYFGVIEEFRLWNIAKSQADIQADMCRTLPIMPLPYLSTPDPELMCYLKYNECTGDVAVDASGNDNNGDTSSAFRVCSEAPVGDDAATPDYIGNLPGEYLVSYTSANGETLAVTGDGGAWNGTPATVPPYKSGLQVYRVNGAPEPDHGPMGSRLFGDRGYFGVFVTGGDFPTYSVTYTYNDAGIGDEAGLDLMYRHHGCAPWMHLDITLSNRNIGANTLAQTGMEGTEYILGKNVEPRNAINFDGSNDYVDVADDTSLDLTTDGTLEAWIYVSTIQTAGIIYKVDTSGANPDGYSLGIDASGYVLFSLYESVGPSATSVTSTTALSTGIWYHIAATWDNGELMHLYINGVLNASSAAAQSSGDPTGVNLTLGSDNTNFFRGAIDEVRIWNVARAQADIRSTMCKKVTSADAGFANLMGYWQFDEETDSCVCPDKTVNDNDGTMSTNFGACPSLAIRDARIPSDAPIGDYSANNYTVAAGYPTITLDPSPSRGSFQATAIGVVAWPANSGIHVYRIDEAPLYPPDLWLDPVPPYGYISPNGLTPPAMWSSIDYYRYFGVFVTDPAPGLTYNVVYDYTNNPMRPDDDSEVRLARRPAYSFGTWTDTVVTPPSPTPPHILTYGDNAQNTAPPPPLIGNKQNPEYVLGGDDAPLAIALASFTATADNGCVEVAWETATEINTAGFHVWRSDNPLTGFVRVTGSVITSTSEMETLGAKYSFRDCGVDFATSEKYYYMLEEIEIDGPASGNMNGPIGPVSENVTAAQTNGGGDSKACFIGVVSDE